MAREIWACCARRMHLPTLAACGESTRQGPRTERAAASSSSSSSSGAAVEVYKLKAAIGAIGVALSEYGAGNAKGAAAGALAAVLGPIVKAIVLRQIRKRAEGKKHFL